MDYENLLVPEGTRRIVRHQFKNLELEEIVLPEGLEWIGAHCFRNSKLRRLVLPSTVKRIDFGAFSSCDWLEEVIFPEGIQKIGRYAFSECENLSRIVIPETACIEEGAFYEYRLRNGCCPWCGTHLDRIGECPKENTHARSWTGSLRLYRGLFWWNGEKLITVKVHCVQTGYRGYSVPFFGKRETLGSHKEEWELLKKSGNPDVKEVPRYDTFPRGRVEIENFTARIFMHPELNTPEIRKKIRNEFGLSEEIQGLKEIKFITDYSEHYHNPMNVLPYVNSKDIREHLEKIGYQFTALEAAWLIYQSRDTTLEERHHAWRQLISEYPDCPIPERMNTVAQPSLHRFLEEYMDMENRALERFRDQTGAVYRMEYHSNGFEPTFERRVFSRFEPEKMHSLFEEEDDRSIWCKRIPVDGSDIEALESFFYVKLNKEMQILEIYPDIPDDDHDRELMLDVFQGFWFDFPTPFQRGDILWDPNKPDGFCGGPFVCHSINLHGIADEKKMEYMRENADDSDMTAHGLFVSDQTGVYGEVMSNYMNCEYYRKELVGAQLLLKPFSAYEKGEADAELLVHACHYIMLELEKEYTGIEFYTAETLKKVGIG